jgi:UDP-N-acetylmuramyl pentapeptide synthase
MALGSGFDTVCFVGAEFKKALSQLPDNAASVFDTSADLAQWLSTKSLSGFSCLIKGSRGTRMEKVIESL